VAHGSGTAPDSKTEKGRSCSLSDVRYGKPSGRSSVGFLLSRDRQFSKGMSSNC